MATTFYRAKLDGNNDGTGSFTSATENLSLTSFFGGTRRGRSLQLTLVREYVLLTKSDAQGLRNQLNRWLDGDALTEAERKDV